jgi:hypothetical protein
MSNDTSVFPVSLLENPMTGPITYQGEEVRGSPAHANNSADAIVREAIPPDSTNRDLLAGDMYISR